MGKGEIEEKMQEHLDSKGSKYVSSRGMFKLVWSKDGFTASEALTEVHRIKSLGMEQLSLMIKGN